MILGGVPEAHGTEPPFAFLLVLKPQSDGLFEVLVCEFADDVPSLRSVVHRRMSLFEEEIKGQRKK